MAWFIGLMSGTSLDGVDGVLARAGALDTASSVPCAAPSGSSAAASPGTRHHCHVPMPAALRAELLALNSRGGHDELHRAALAANALMVLYADAVAQLLAAARLQAGAVTAIGAHGQTVRHRPGEFDGSGYTLQLMNGALLAERTGIDVVCDLRSRDLAAGGQGAPLVPAFHGARFGRRGHDIAVLNLGGIANLSLLRAGGAVTGFDCGPANVLMDLWCQRQRGQPFDAGGAWAASGQVDATLLAHLLDEPFFGMAPPKSTGRDLFDARWLDARLAAFAGLAPQDVMATLAELTARSVGDALKQQAPATTRLLVCGGGAFNADLLRRIAAAAGSAVQVQRSDAEGVAPDQVEALAFAWLAQAFVQRQPGNLPAVTGARGPRVLGCLYPAG